MTYDLFCTVHEDVLEWLLSMEDLLAAMPEVPGEGLDLAGVKALFNENAEFMERVNAEHKSVGKVGHGTRYICSVTGPVAQ